MPTVTIGENSTNTHTGTIDTTLRQSEPTTNQDGESINGLQVVKYAASDHTHTVIAFTGLSNIPSTATVSAVTLYLYQHNSAQGSGPATHTLDVRRLLRNWVETQATWNVYSTGNSWTTAGALSAGNDRVSTVSGGATVNMTNNEYKALTGSGMITDVQDWVSGAASNFGWHVERNGTGEDNGVRLYRRSEDTDGQRPYVEVTYTVPPVSSPTDGIVWVRPPGFA